MNEQVKKLFAVSASAVLLSAVCQVANAEVVNYTIDPAQSFLSVSGDLGGNPASQQSAGSLTTSYSGTIVADRGTGTITFPGGSSVDAALQPTSQSPRSDGTPGSQPADYGRTGIATLGPFGPNVPIDEALRGFNFDIESDPITLSGTNTFNGNDFGTVVNSGDAYWLYGTVSGEKDFFNAFSFNSSVGPSLIEVNGFVEKLTLNIGANYAYSVAQTGDSNARFSGQIVATRIIPEPSAIGALAIAGGSLLARRRRRG